MTPHWSLADLVTSLVATTMNNRMAGGWYRWKGDTFKPPTKMPSNAISHWSTAASSGRWPPDGPNSPRPASRHCQPRRCR